MSELKLYGMKAAYDEIIATATLGAQAVSIGRPAGMIRADAIAGQIAVRTYDDAGALADRSYYLSVGRAVATP